MEIGSEFWKDYFSDTITNKNEKHDVACLLSGRTALDFIIQDIRIMRRFKKVLLPSYCCESMVEPFIQNNIEVQFYTVTQDGIDYPENDADVILLIDYFGYQNPKNKELAALESKSGKTVIYDATHKINGRDFPADYVFCSFRKWMYCNFAVAWKKHGDFSVEQPDSINRAYIDLRNLAAKCKGRFMSGGLVDKTEYLRLFAEAESLLESDYVGYTGIPACVDEKEIVGNRRRNARYLMEQLKDIKEFCLWKSTITEQDTPLFVPILVKGGHRDSLRNYLIAHQIYCPVHWPVTGFHRGLTDFGKKIYEEELSLVCDQRYGIADMEREVKTIRDFYKEMRGCH